MIKLSCNSHQSQPVLMSPLVIGLHQHSSPLLCPSIANSMRGIEGITATDASISPILATGTLQHIVSYTAGTATHLSENNITVKAAFRKLLYVYSDIPENMGTLPNASSSWMQFYDTSGIEDRVNVLCQAMSAAC